MVLDGRELQMCAEWRSRVCREEGSSAPGEDGFGVSSVYSDPSLVRRPAMCGEFLGDPHARSIAGLSSARPAAVGVFFASANDGSPRMIFDT
eukprot:7242878-Pyramimonas_sp.AAC.1